MTYRAQAPSFVCLVETNDDDFIVEAAPLLQRFIGQPLYHLKQWVEKLGGYVIAL